MARSHPDRNTVHGGDPPADIASAPLHRSYESEHAQRPRSTWQRPRATSRTPSHAPRGEGHERPQPHVQTQRTSRSRPASSGEQKVPEIGCQERAARWAMLEPWQRDGHCAAGKPPLGRYGRCQAVLSVLDVRFTHLLFEHRREGQSREALLGASSKSLSFKIGPMVADLPCETRKQGTLSRSICTHKQR